MSELLSERTKELLIKYGQLDNKDKDKVDTDFALFERVINTLYQSLLDKKVLAEDLLEVVDLTTTHMILIAVSVDERNALMQALGFPVVD
jgi:hypothetical protein